MKYYSKGEFKLGKSSKAPEEQDLHRVGSSFLKQVIVHILEF